MDAILSPCIATLLRCENSSFTDLQRFMDDNNNADLLALGQQSPNPQHRLLFRHKFNSPLFSATKHGIYTRLQVILNDQTFQNLISNTTTVNLKQLIEEKEIILQGCTIKEYKAAYIQLIKLYHPDKISGLSGSRKAQAENEVKQINAAWDTIKKKLK